MSLPRIDFTQTRAYQSLLAHYPEVARRHLRELFSGDPDRFRRFSIEWEGILFDYSKNRIDETTLELLIAMAEECDVPGAIELLFSGASINETEGRPALHTALRDRSDQPILAEGKDVMPEVQEVLKQIEEFSESVINGSWKGYTGRSITDVVNIGIGGSSLGPLMVTEALKAYKNQLNIHFVSNVDGTQIHETLRPLNPETTLFVVVSKSFSTQETMANAHTARQWLQEAISNRSLDATHQALNELKNAVSKHFIAVSTNREAVTEFGILPENRFRFWDWVGGRYSLWSAVGITIALSVGFKRFEELLEGGYEADQHFRYTELARNIPVLMALLGVWYVNFFGAETHAILPYDQYLHRFAAYLQQGEMESNGKSTNRQGQRVHYQTCPIIWGEPGTDGQHAFFQLMHQGTRIIPADFIASARSQHPVGNHHRLLISNFFAQTEALMNGRTIEEIQAELDNSNTKSAERVLPFQVFEGNRPSTSFLIDQITPRQLGKLIALYEHKIFVQGVMWNIFSFDQWGVELGKKLAHNIQSELENTPPDKPVAGHDASTNGLINAYRKWA